MPRVLKLRLTALIFKVENSLAWDDPKLSDDSGHVPKPNGVVGGLTSGHEILSLLDEKLVKWSNASYTPPPKKKTKTK